MVSGDSNRARLLGGRETSVGGGERNGDSNRERFLLVVFRDLPDFRDLSDLSALRRSELEEAGDRWKTQGEGVVGASSG